MIMQPTCLGMAVFALFLGIDARADAPRVERVESLLRGYADGFISPATDLAYGIRINGPRGIAVLESPAEITAGRVRGEYRPWGYGAGIEDLAFQTGMLLFALCDAEESTGRAAFAQMARRREVSVDHDAESGPGRIIHDHMAHPKRKRGRPNGLASLTLRAYDGALCDRHTQERE